MSEFNEHINPVPNGQGNPNWQRLFDEAAETPPPRVWNAIERDLDREEDDRVIIIPFWGRSSSWAWSAAAAVALVLLGWWSLRIPENAALSTRVLVPKSTNRETNQDQSTKPETMAARKTEVTTQPKQSTNRSEQLSDSPTQLPTIVLTQPNRNGLPPIINEKQLSQPAFSEPNKSIATGPTANSLSESIQEQTIATTSEEVITTASEQTLATASDLAMMSSRSLQLPSMYGTQRIVWFQPTETVTADKKSEKPKSEHWASVSVMPSSFNPGVGLLPASATYGNAFAKTSNMAYSTANPSLESQPNLSMAYQVSSGIQLSSRWSVETGVGYLEGRSTVNSPVQTIVSALAPNGRLSNLYADALNNSRVSNDLGSNTARPPVTTPPPTGSGGNQGLANAGNAFINPNVYDVARPQQLANNYTFVQFPIQLGYQIRPRKRLGFTVLGGLLTNLFVRNTVNDQLSITNSDMVYRPVTLSASTGLRFRYRPTRRWSASMAGIFQQALQRGTRVGADLTTRPQTMGVSVGLDYHF